MIQLVDRAVERLLRRSAALAENQVDISFDAPDRTWGAARTRPTVNVFLWEVTRNPAYLQAGMQLARDPDSNIAVARRPKTPVVDLHYMITAWTAEKSDEHQLLGAILDCVLQHNRLPDDLLPEPLAGKMCRLGLAPYDKRPPGEFWSALDGRLRPGVQVEVTVPFEVFGWETLAAPPASVVASAGRVPATPTSPAEGPSAPLSRRRANGAMVMEGRPEDFETADADASGIEE